MSIFISVDPLVEETGDAYGYCYQNPINLTDPTGMSAEEGDPPGFFASIGNWFKRQFGADIESDYQEIPNDDGYGFDITLDEVQINLDKETSKKPGDRWQSGGDFYTQINKNTLTIYNPSTEAYSYGLSLPQDFGSWGQTGSDGLIWIGCTSCHAENGAYRYIAYNSIEHKVGLIGAIFLDAALTPSPVPSSFGRIGRSINSIDDIMANPNLLRRRTPQEIEAILGNTHGWKVETLRKGSQRGNGWVLRQYNSMGNEVGPHIRWHPRGGHHGSNSYWRVVGTHGDLGGVIYN